MTIPLSFASAIGNLFNRLGKLALSVKQAKSYQTAQLANLTDTTNGAVAQYNSESDIQAFIGSGYQGILSSPEAIGSLATNVAALTVNRMVFRSNPQLGQTLQTQNTLISLQEIIRQMGVEGASVLAMTVGGTPTPFIGQGNGVITFSANRPLDGKVLENTFAENLLFVCSQDSFIGGATAGNESFQITGTGSQSDVFAFNWPLGSNCSFGLNAIDGNTSNGSGNLLTNSGFESWPTIAPLNIPTSWLLDVGIAGTAINKETTIIYDGLAALRVTGDGSTLVQLRQQFGNSAGTLGSLSPLTQYSLNIFMRRDAVAAGTGLWLFEIVDGNGLVISDANGIANSFQVDLTKLTTGYTAYNVSFRTPVILPPQQFLRMRMPFGNALSNNRSVYLDKLSLGLSTQSYTSGPFLALHAGSIPFLQGDYATVAVTNSRGAGGTLSTWQSFFQQCFYSLVMGNELLLPSSNVPTISDNLIG